jgi:hypothetical protein
MDLTKEAIVHQLVAHDYNKRIAEARHQQYPQLTGTF